MSDHFQILTCKAVVFLAHEQLSPKAERVAFITAPLYSKALSTSNPPNEGPRRLSDEQH